jgi:hypothetical protein
MLQMGCSHDHFMSARLPSTKEKVLLNCLYLSVLVMGTAQSLSMGELLRVYSIRCLVVLEIEFLFELFVLRPARHLLFPKSVGKEPLMDVSKLDFNARDSLHAKPRLPISLKHSSFANEPLFPP